MTTNTISIENRTYRVDVEYDQDAGVPWEHQDGHGIVSKWVTRNKYAGEWVLSSDHQSKLFYDFASTMKKAKSECWGLNDESKNKLAKKLNKSISELTKGEITAESVRLDYEYLRAWCNDEWHYCGVVVTDITDDEDAPIDYSFVLWGIESNDDAYIQETAVSLANEAYRVFITDNRFQLAMENGI